MSFLSSISLAENSIFQYTPAAFQAINIVENATAGTNTTGKTKEAMALNLVSALAAAGQTIPIPQVQETAALISLIAGLVKALNDSGAFTHAHKTPPAPAAAPATSFLMNSGPQMLPAAA